MKRKATLLLVSALVSVTAVFSKAVVFEDSRSRSNDYGTDPRALRITQTPTGQSLEEEDGRLHHHNHNRRKTKPVICGIAHLVAKREAADRRRREAPEQGKGLGVAGFLLGAYVGSKYQQHQYQYQNQPHPPPPHNQQQQQQQQQGGQQQQQQQQQGSNNEDYDQVEDQGGGGGGIRPGGGGNRPPRPPGGGGIHPGGGAGSICNSLQQQNAQQYIGGIGSGSHFPILASILSSGGGGGNRIGQLPQNQNQAQVSQNQRPGPVQFSQYQRPVPIYQPQSQRPAPVYEPQLQRPAPMQFQSQRPAGQQQNGFLDTYVRPWVDLFLK